MQTQKGFANIILVIVIVLLVGAAGYLALIKKPAIGPETETGTNENEITEQEEEIADSLVCGIFVETPKPGDQIIIGSTFQVKGYVNGCGWTAFEGEAAVISAEDINGNPTLNPRPIPVSGEWMQLPAYFDYTFPMPYPATAGQGFLIFQNEDPSGENPQTFKVPINF